jgi:hypothetical protein
VRVAITHLNARRLTRQSDYAVMTALILACDKEGVLWPKPREIAVTVGMALNTVLASLRRLKKEGLVDWARLAPFKRWPRRVSYKAPVVLGRGKANAHGGRVLVVRWENLGVSFPSRDLARKVEDRSNLDRSGSIHLDRSSDPLDLSSRDLKSDCASPSEGGTRPPVAGPESAPPPASNVATLQSRGFAVPSFAPPPTISPAVGRAPRAAPLERAPRPSPAIARAGGEEASESSDAPVTVADMRASLAFLFPPRPPEKT